MELEQNYELKTKDQALVKRQQDVQLDVAKIQAETAKEVAATQAAPAQRRITELELPTLPDRLKVLANQAATSTKEFQLFMKSLSMAPANLVATGAYAKWKSLGFDMLDPESWKKVPQKMRQRAMQEVLAESSNVAREAAGVEKVARDVNKRSEKVEMKLPDKIKEYGRSFYNYLFPPIAKRESVHYKN